jgi:hypothetical protein
LPTSLHQPPARAVDWIGRVGLQPDYTDFWNGISPFVTSSVLWSLYSFLRSPDDYWEAICTAIAVGGDVDTTAAMTGAIAGPSWAGRGFQSPLRVSSRTKVLGSTKTSSDSRTSCTGSTTCYGVAHPRNAALSAARHGIAAIGLHAVHRASGISPGWCAACAIGGSPKYAALSAESPSICLSFLRMIPPWQMPD